MVTSKANSANIIRLYCKGERSVKEQYQNSKSATVTPEVTLVSSSPSGNPIIFHLFCEAPPTVRGQPVQSTTQSETVLRWRFLATVKNKMKTQRGNYNNQLSDNNSASVKVKG